MDVSTLHIITYDGIQLFELFICNNLLFLPSRVSDLPVVLSVTFSVHINLLIEIMWIIYSLTLTLSSALP